MWATSGGKDNGSAFHFKIRCPAGGLGAVDAEPPLDPSRLALREDSTAGLDALEEAVAAGEDGGSGNTHCFHFLVPQT